MARKITEATKNFRRADSFFSGWFSEKEITVA